jgi:multiple sugar transport system ATP-binding protein
MARLALKGLTKQFGAVEAVRGVDLDVAHEEFVVLVGPSGCGKSTILRMIAGLEEASGGEIHIGERLVNNIAPKDRNIAMVFQNYALYPHKTVHGNMAFALRAQRLPKADVERRVQQAAAILGLEDLMQRKPGELSGGQRQRVAMGRAIVRDPAVFLFDEPLSNLDAELRARLRSEIKKLHRKLRATIVYVTHDQVEAMTLADRVVILNKGRIEQVGTPMEVYAEPANLFVAGFIGTPAMNMIPAEMTADAAGRRCVLAAASRCRSIRRIASRVRPERRSSSGYGPKILPCCRREPRTLLRRSSKAPSLPWSRSGRNSCCRSLSARTRSWRKSPAARFRNSASRCGSPSTWRTLTSSTRRRGNRFAVDALYWHPVGPALPVAPPAGENDPPQSLSREHGNRHVGRRRSCGRS